MIRNWEKETLALVKVNNLRLRFQNSIFSCWSLSWCLIVTVIVLKSVLIQGIGNWNWNWKKRNLCIHIFFCKLYCKDIICELGFLHLSVKNRKFKQLWPILWMIIQTHIYSYFLVVYNQIHEVIQKSGVQPSLSQSQPLKRKKLKLRVSFKKSKPEKVKTHFSV